MIVQNGSSVGGESKSRFYVESVVRAGVLTNTETFISFHSTSTAIS